MTAVALALLLASLALAGCASPAPAGAGHPHARPPADRPLRAGDRDQIVMTAFAQIGKPYIYGGNGPEGFDCSGLVRYAYGAGGAKTPRTTAELYASGRTISQDAAQPGDLFFYALDPSRSGPSHVVFYLGDGEGIHAPASGSAIRAVKLGIPYFSQRFLAARRLLE